MHEDQHVCDDGVIEPLCFGEWGAGYQALDVVVGYCTEVAIGWVNGMWTCAEEVVCTLFLWCGWGEWVLCIGVVLAGVLRNMVCPDTSGGGAYRSDPSGLGGLVF